MPLHDWAGLSGWEGVHLLWMTELLRDLKAKLPPEFRAYIGSGPALAVGVPSGGGRPDVAVRSHGPVHDTGPAAAPAAYPEVSEPDVEVAVATLDPDPAL